MGLTALNIDYFLKAELLTYERLFISPEDKKGYKHGSKLQGAKSLVSH